MDTSLSPRLRHLLIHEDRETGRLILPLATPMSPPMSPTSPALPTPPEGPTQLAPFATHYRPSSSRLPMSLDLPRPIDRRPSGSLLNLLHDMSVQSPPPSAGSSSSSEQSLRSEQDRHRRELARDERPQQPPGGGSSRVSFSVDVPPQRSASMASTSSAVSYASARSDGSHHSGDSRTPRAPHTHTLPPPLPLSAPLPSPHGMRGGPQAPFFEPRRSVHVAPSPYPPRPDLLRRHSSHPYEYNPASRPAPAGYMVPSYPAVPVIGARAPISRTTKACNACRARKVRCDAGGLGAGETGTCSRCRESGVACVYTSLQKKRGPCPGPSLSRGRRASSQRGSMSQDGQDGAYPYESWQQQVPPAVTGWSYSGHEHGPPSRAHAAGHLHGTKPGYPERMERVLEHELDPRGMFEKGYSMRGHSGPGYGAREQHHLRPSPDHDDIATGPGARPHEAPFAKAGTSLPPLRVAIRRSDSYYEP